MFRDVAVIRRADQRRMRWKNGAGWTTELVVRPLGAAEFDWRVSVAEVEADCDFSPFPGVDRTILVLAGEGFTLHVGDDEPVRLRAGDPPLAFSGDRPARCVVAGPSRDFNVMTRRAACTHALVLLAGPTPRVLARPAGRAWVAHVLEGSAQIGDDQAEAGECLVVEPAPEDRSSIELRPAGRIALVELRPIRGAAAP